MTTVKQETLDDCPFCGGVSVSVGERGCILEWKHFTGCKKCNIWFHYSSMESEKELAKEQCDSRWNTRAKTKREAVLVAELESEKKLSEHWRKVAYELGGVTEEQVKEFITQQALAQMEGE